MSSERAAKLRRLHAFRRAVPHVSATALSSILGEVEATGVPDLHSRRDIGRASADEVDEVTPYGSIMTMLDLVQNGGGSVQVSAVCPQAFLYKAFRQGGGFSNLLAETFRQQPPTPERPWRFVLYSDEVVPGNVLASNNRRKVWVVYASFLEFGPMHLADEDAWFCISATRFEWDANCKDPFVFRSLDGSMWKCAFGPGRCPKIRPESMAPWLFRWPLDFS
jgi:hypothetical protein